MDKRGKRGANTAFPATGQTGFDRQKERNGGDAPIKGTNLKMAA